MSEVACLRVCPFVPYSHSVVLQILHVGVASEKPQEFVYYGFEVHLLRGNDREAVLKVETHLMPKDADCSCACSVGFLHALGLYSS